MSLVKIILFSLLGVGVTILIVSLLISKHLKNKQNPNFKPIFSKKERIISSISIVVGIALIVAGIFLPSFLNKTNGAEYAEELSSEAATGGGAGGLERVRVVDAG